MDWSFAQDAYHHLHTRVLVTLAVVLYSCQCLETSKRLAYAVATITLVELAIATECRVSAILAHKSLFFALLDKFSHWRKRLSDETKSDSLLTYEDDDSSAMGSPSAAHLHDCDELFAEQMAQTPVAAAANANHSDSSYLTSTAALSDPLAETQVANQHEMDVDSCSSTATAATSSQQEELPLLFSYCPTRSRIQNVLRQQQYHDDLDLWIIYYRDWLRDHIDGKHTIVVYDDWNSATRARLASSNAVVRNGIVVQPFQECNEEIQYRVYATGAATCHPLSGIVRLAAKVDVLAPGSRRVLNIPSVLDTGAATSRLLLSLAELGMDKSSADLFSQVTCGGTRMLCWRVPLEMAASGTNEFLPTAVYVPLSSDELKSDALRVPNDLL